MSATTKTLPARVDSRVRYYEVRPQASARQRGVRLDVAAAVTLAGLVGTGAGVRGANR
jgi:hypothetical protein